MSDSSTSGGLYTPANNNEHIAPTAKMETTCLHRFMLDTTVSVPSIKYERMQKIFNDEKELEKEQDKIMSNMTKIIEQLAESKVAIEELMKTIDEKEDENGSET